MKRAGESILWWGTTITLALMVPLFSMTVEKWKISPNTLPAAELCLEKAAACKYLLGVKIDGRIRRCCTSGTLYCNRGPSPPQTSLFRTITVMVTAYFILAAYPKEERIASHKGCDLVRSRGMSHFSDMLCAETLPVDFSSWFSTWSDDSLSLASHCEETDKETLRV